MCLESASCSASQALPLQRKEKGGGGGGGRIISGIVKGGGQNKVLM